jgi:hypothetical protein
VIFVSGLENGYYLIGIVDRLPDGGLFWVRIIYRNENRLDAGRMAGLHAMSYLFTHGAKIFGFLDPRPDPVRLVGVSATLEIDSSCQKCAALLDCFDPELPNLVLDITWHSRWSAGRLGLPSSFRRTSLMETDLGRPVLNWIMCKL